MNEYQDQAEWFELQAFCVLHNHWQTMHDYDTREDAIEAYDTITSLDRYGEFRVRRVTGLPA